MLLKISTNISEVAPLGKPWNNRAMSEDLLHLPNFLVIGAYSRNAGKTSFSRRVIEDFQGNILAVKITVVSQEHDCPHGDEGCGVCSSLCSPFEITEETDSTGDKDTSKLLKAGAVKVYWMRVSKGAVRSGLEALSRILDLSIPVLCESNSIVHYIEPGLYIQLKALGRRGNKKSARVLAERADLIVETTPEGADFNFSSLLWSTEGWSLQNP